MKHLVLFDILQQKRVGGYFNDFTYAQKDKLPDEKGLTCVVSGNDGLFVAVGGENGNLYVLRNWLNQQNHCGVRSMFLWNSFQYLQLD